MERRCAEQRPAAGGGGGGGSEPEQWRGPVYWVPITEQALGGKRFAALKRGIHSTKRRFVGADSLSNEVARAVTGSRRCTRRMVYLMDASDSGVLAPVESIRLIGGMSRATRRGDDASNSHIIPIRDRIDASVCGTVPIPDRKHAS